MMTKNYFISLDNLCITKNNNYIQSKPILENINFINELKKAGNSIIIWTNRSKSLSELTKKQLKDWGVKYNELIIEKPDYKINFNNISGNINSFFPFPIIKNEKSKKEKLKIVEKGWGKEIIFANNEDYCGKLLCFEKGKKFSMHCHLKKKETWYVSKGTFIFIGIQNNTIFNELLSVGDVLTNERGELHQLIALEDGEIIEVSTKHLDEDSFRMWKGD